MAKIASAAGGGNQVVGKVFILFGTVKAVSPDGVVRVLAPNSPIYADDRIITGSEGSVSIQFDGPPVTQLDLGRMTEIVVDEDVYAGVAPEAVSEAAAEAEQVQQSLLEGDQPIELEATAAGGGTGAGGGHSVVYFTMDGGSVTPVSGAETTSVTFTTVNTIGGVFGAAPAPAEYTGVITLTGTESITEAAGQVVTYTATVDNPPVGSDLVLTLSNGGTITIHQGETSGSVTGTSSGAEDVYVDAPINITTSITGATGGDYTSLDISDTAITSMTDTLDEVTVSIASDGDVNEATAASFTVSVSVALDRDLTVTLSNGETVTIEAGHTSATYTAAAQGEDVYKDGGSVELSVTGASVEGAEFEKLVISETPATVNITDTTDATTVTLSAPESVTEDAAGVTFTATLSNAGETDVTITTNLGEIVIKAGDTEGTLFVATADPDAYVDPSSITATVTGVEGGNFEEVIFTSATVTTQITDTINAGDTTTVTLSAPESVTEDAAGVTFTATLSNAGETDVTITTNLGEIVIKAGDTEGTLFVATADPDVYVDPSSITATVTGVEGGNFEAVNYSEASATTAIDDTTDTTTVTLSAPESVTEDAAGVTFTATLSNAGETDVTITTNLGEIVIKAGDTEGTLFVAMADPDVYVDPSSITATVTGVEGGNFEAVNYSEASATTAIDDTTDTTTVTVGGADVNENADGVTFTFQLSNPPQGDASVTVMVGATEHTVDVNAAGYGELFIATADPDVYVDPSSVTATVTAINGGNFEATDVTGASFTADVTDINVDGEDTTTVTVGGADVNENADGVTFTFQLSNPPQGDASVTVMVGATEHTVDVNAAGYGELFIATADPDVYVDLSSVTATVTAINGGNFEATDVTGASFTADVTDINVDGEDTTTVTVGGADVNENADGVTFTFQLSNPPQGDASVTVMVGATEHTVDVNAAGYGELFIATADPDVYVDPSSVTATVTAINGGNFEATDVTGASFTADVTDINVDGEDTTTVTVGGADVNENADGVTFTFQLSNPPQGDASVTVMVGATEHTVDVNAAGYGELFIATADPDVYVDPSSVTATVTAINGGNFEATDVTGASFTADVTDINVDGEDTTTVTVGGADVNENADGVTFTFQLSNPPQGDASVTVMVGATEHTVDVNAAGYGELFIATADPDVYVDLSSVTATVTAINGGNFEATDVTGASFTADVTDINVDGEDTTTVTVGGADVNENADGVTFTFQLSNPPQGDASVTVMVGATEHTVDVNAAGYGELFIATADPDVYVDPSSVTATVTAINGGNFEDTDVTGASFTADVTDIGAIDQVTATLTASDSPIPETGGTITYTVTLSGPEGMEIATKSPLTFNLSNGEQVTIGEDQTFGSVKITYGDNDIIDQANITNSFDSVKPIESGGDQYENLVTIGSTTVDVDYVPVISDLTPETGGGDLVVDEGDLLANRGAGESAGSEFEKTSTTVTGTFKITAPDGVDNVTVDGHAVITNGAFATASFATDLGNTLAITGYDSTTGVVTYTYTLADNETHPTGEGENSLYENFTVTLTDQDHDRVESTLSVKIVDDVPTARPGTNTIDEPTVGEGTEVSGTYNVTIVLDTSGSMEGNKIALAKDAINNLLTEYGGEDSANAAKVNVLIVGFDEHTETPGWLTLAEAKAYVSDASHLQAGGSTNYELALEATMTAYGAKPDADTNVLYFLSDGEPRTGGEGTGHHVSSSDVTAWEGWLTEHSMDAYAVGIGTTDAADQDLEAVAFSADGGAADTPIIIDSATELNATLLTLIEPGPPVIDTVEGNVMTDGTPDTPGADGATVTGISTDAGNNFTPVTGAVGTVVDTALGELTIFADGHYHYTATTPISEDEHDIFTYRLTDGDGDTSQSTLDITVLGTNDAPTSTNDSVTIDEDTTLVLGLDDFGTYTDIESNPMAAVKITTLESNGSLEYNNEGTWVAVAQDQEISATDISAGKLQFVPDANENGTPYANIGFKVGDGIDFSENAYILKVNVAAVNDGPPVITSDGGGDTAEITVHENTKYVTTVEATDPDMTPLEYSIIGGADKNLFTIDSNSGELDFLNKPNYEKPKDVGQDNHYDVTVQVSDGSLTDTQDISVLIEDVQEHNH